MLLSDTPKMESPDTPQNQKLRATTWQETWLAFGVAYLFFLLLIPHFTTWLTPVTGDEPFYLVTAQSMIADFDLDERNNYEQHDYWKFSPSCEEVKQPGWGAGLFSPGVVAPGIQLCPAPYDALAYPLPPHDSKGVLREGMYTKHGLGLSFLIAPAWAIGGRWLVMATLAAFAALIAANVYLLAFETTGKRQTAWLTWVLMVFAAPLICYALLIFPATPAALMVIYTWRRLRLAALERIEARQQGRTVFRRNNAGQAFLVGGCIGFLPWLHSVFLILSASLALYWLMGGRDWHFPVKRFSLLPSGYSALAHILFGLPIVVFGALFLTYYIYYYGTPLPNTQDHAGFATIPDNFLGIFGLLFDQKWGLLIYAPIYLIALAGLGWMPFRVGDKAATALRRSQFGWLLVTIAPYYLTMATYKQWWGEWCPPARYLMPIIPLLALPLAIALTELSQKARALFIPLCGLCIGWSFAIAAIFMTYPKVMYHWQDEAPAKLLTWLQTNVELFKEVNLGALFPSFATLLTVQKDTPFVLTAVVWIGATFLVLGLLLFMAVRSRKKLG